MPSPLAAAKASSRFGPTIPRALASASVWHEAQLGLGGTPRMKSCLPTVAFPPWARPPVPQPAETATARTAKTAPASANRTLGRLAGGACLRERLVAGRVDREDAVEPRDLEDLGDVPVAADEREPAVLRAQPLDPAYEHAECRRVDERRVREVDDHILGPLADHVQQMLLELRSGVEIDLARQRNHIRAVADLVRLHVEVHLPSLAREFNGHRARR